MKKIAFMLLLAMVFCVSAHADEKFDCKKHSGVVWVGQITNPSKIPIKLEIYNNEKVEGTDLIGVDNPYFEMNLQPGESVEVEYQCGENSIIMIDEQSKSFKAMDFHVPNTFLKGDNPLFKYELKQKRIDI
jgi:hypothetical protein